MSGTCVFTHCCKADTPAGNTTKAEMDAANQLGHALRWMYLLMEDIGLPFDGPVPVAEENSATRIIAHTGKITGNVRYIASKTLSFQALVRKHIALFRAVGSAQNKADHFTKALALPAFREHSWDYDSSRPITLRLHSSSDVDSPICLLQLQTLQRRGEMSS
jgi:hypothetical protein